jgi:Tfp pilus assembly protein PilX
MFTFLIGEYREKIVGEYRKRLLVFFLLFVFLITLVLAGLALPVYISLRSQRDALLLEKNSSAQRVAESERADLETQIQNIRDMVTATKENGIAKPLVFTLENILAHRSNTVSLTSISMERKKDSWAVNIGGIAASREALVEFKEKLEIETDFSAVDLPVSSLAKSKNIPFSLTLHSKL